MKHNLQKPEVLRARNVIIFESPYADDPRLDTPDAGSMLSEYPHVPPEVARGALESLTQLADLDMRSPERVAGLLAIADTLSDR